MSRHWSICTPELQDVRCRTSLGLEEESADTVRLDDPKACTHKLFTFTFSFTQR